MTVREILLKYRKEKCYFNKQVTDATNDAMSELKKLVESKKIFCADWCNSKENNMYCNCGSFDYSKAVYDIAKLFE